MGPIYQVHQVANEETAWVPQSHAFANRKDLGCSLQGPPIPLLLGKWKGLKLEL